jgi:hypothetical protein
MDVVAGSVTDATVPDFHFDPAKVPDGLCAAHLVYSKRRHEQVWREFATLYNGGTVPYVPNDREFTEKYGERGFSADAYDVTHVQYNHKKHVWAIARGGISIGRSGPKLKDLTWKVVQPEYLVQDVGVCPRWMLGIISIGKASNDQLKEAKEKDRIGYAPLKNSYYYALPVRVLEKKITAETHPDGSPERKGHFSFKSHFSAALASVVSTKRGGDSSPSPSAPAPVAKQPCVDRRFVPTLTREQVSILSAFVADQGDGWAGESLQVATFERASLSNKKGGNGGRLLAQSHWRRWQGQA